MFHTELVAYGVNDAGHSLAGDARPPVDGGDEGAEEATGEGDAGGGEAVDDEIVSCVVALSEPLVAVTVTGDETVFEPLYAMLTVEAGLVTDVVESWVAPDVSLEESVIGDAYGSEPMIVLPSASCAVTVTAAVAAVPSASVLGFGASASLLTTPLNVRLSVVGCCATIAVVVDPVESTLPVPFKPS